MDRQTKGTAGEIIEPLSCNIVANKLGHGTGPSSPVSSFSSDAKDPVEGHSSQVHNIEHKEELVLHIISQEGVESKPIASHIQESSAISISTSTSVQQSPTSDNIPTSLEDEQIINDLPWWYPRCRGKPILRGNKEGLGFACTTVAQSIVVIGLAAFIIPAVIVLAKEEAGCETEAPSSSEKVPECNKKVYGFKPSSLLTLMSSVVGLISACIIPLGGAIVDYTHHRRLVGRITAFLFWALTSMLVFLGTDIDWFPLALIIIVAVPIGWGQTMLYHAYLPELTGNEQHLSEFSKAFTISMYTSMVLYLVTVMGIGTAFGLADDEISLARVASLVALVVSALLFSFAWVLLFRKRPATHSLPEGRSLLTAGFHQVYQTTTKIYKEYRALKFFYTSVVFGDAAIQSLAVIAITYVTDQLQFSSQEVGIAAILLLFGAIPGALVGALLNKKINPIRTSASAVVCMMVGISLAATFLTGPGQQSATYFFAFSWGVGTGWKATSDRILSAGLIPENQDTELMGFFMFCGQVLTWVPSVVFTVLNEADVSQRIGLASLNVMLICSLIAYLKMGSYSDAIAVANRLQLETLQSPDKPTTIRDDEKTDKNIIAINSSES